MRDDRLNYQRKKIAADQDNNLAAERFRDLLRFLGCENFVYYMSRPWMGLKKIMSSFGFKDMDPEMVLRDFLGVYATRNEKEIFLRLL